jgi:hypothetical protein
MKTHKQFSAALHGARAEFVLARRDDLHLLSNRALETLLAILDNPRSSPAVLLRTAMFILQRPQLPKTGWSMPEPAPVPHGEALIDSAIIEQDFDKLPDLYNIQPDDPAENATPPAAESVVPPPSDDPECYTMQHHSGNNDAVTSPLPPTSPPSCSVPPAVPDSRNQRAHFLEGLDLLNSVEDSLDHEETMKQC